MERIIYAHEHITIDLSGPKGDMDCRLDDRELCIKSLSKLKESGVTALIDQTCRGMGRNPVYAQSIAEETGINLLHATGFYKEPFLPEECYILAEKDIASIFKSEIETGIDGTGIKASFIGEIGTGAGIIAPVEVKIFAAACKTHLDLGIPICTHTTLGKLGLEQISLFNKYGADLSKVVLSHIDLSEDTEYMLKLLDTGVNIGFDTVGKNNYTPDQIRAEQLNFLCGKGYAGQIVLSMDITRRSNCAELGYDYLLTEFIPLLKNKYSFKDSWLNMVLYENPAAIYGLYS